MASATSEIDLLDADTADTITRDTVARNTFSVDGEQCPTIMSWTAGAGERTSDPQPTDEQIRTSPGPFAG